MLLAAVMSYCIIRVAKLRTLGSIAGSAGHTFRELPTPNADPKRTHLNVTIGAKSSKAVCAAIKARLPEKRRKDAVLCIEYLITSSPEWFKEAPHAKQNDYFKGATKWLEDRHGKENIVCLNVQHDETSPHMVAFVVPLTADGRLSAKDFLGGRSKLSAMQTDFHKKVGHPVGLQRGVEGSKAVHTTNKQYNAALKKNPTLKPPEPPAPTIADRVTGRAKRMEEEHATEMAKYAAQVEQARNIALLGQKTRERNAQMLERTRKEAAEHKAEAERLRAENKQLSLDLSRQRAYFEKKLAEMKSMYEAARDQVKSLLTKVRLLGKRIDVLVDERDELQEKLSPPKRKLTGDMLRPGRGNA